MVNTLLIITGPTGAGKTEVALSVAGKLKAEIISADSRQVYQGMDIGTDKVSRKVREKIPHHLIDVASPDEVFTAADFKKKAENIIQRLQREDKLPIVCGGTGLYIKALTHGLFPGPGRNEDLRNKLRLKAKKEGSLSLHEELQRLDPDAALCIHPNDEVRIIRALEVYYKTGTSISEHQRNRTFPPSWKMLKAGLCWRERSTLYKVIEKRVDRMVQKGLVKEVKRLLDAGYGEDLPSMQALGYRQIMDYLKGNISFDEAVAMIKKDTRRFAKRQMTWFRREKGIIWLERENYSSIEDLTDKIIDILMGKTPQVKKILLSA